MEILSQLDDEDVDGLVVEIVYVYSGTGNFLIEFKEWNSNALYRRKWDNSNSQWLAWEKVSAV